MKSYTLNILWTGLSDATPHQRQRSVSVDVPVESDTTDIEDALLSLPWTDHGGIGESRTVRLAEPRDALTDEVVLEVAIPQARAEMEGEAQRDAERREAKLAEDRVKLAVFASGVDDSGHPLIGHFIADSVNTPGAPNHRAIGINRLRISGYIDEAILEGHDDLRKRVEERIAEVNAGALGRAEAELARQEAKRTEERIEQEAKEAAKQEKVDARAAEIKTWAAEHGSERLKAQIELGLPGWPLYLHERMQADWPASVTGSVRAELDNDGEAGDPLVNPSLLQIKAAKAVAARAVELGLAADMDAAVGCVEIVPIEFAADVDEDGYCDGEPVTRTYVTFSSYRPGGECFARKQIRFACEE